MTLLTATAAFVVSSMLFAQPVEGVLATTDLPDINNRAKECPIGMKWYLIAILFDICIS
jgi:hypothetical protein